MTARDVMSKGIFYCFEDDPIEKAAEVMRAKEVHHLPVLNRRKRMVGLVSLGDLALKADQRAFPGVIRLAARDAARHAKAA